jgi:high-affinity iron transporter
LLETYLILVRETLEASLLVGILLSTLKRLGDRKGQRFVLMGAGVAVVCCLFLGLLADHLESFLSGNAKNILDVCVFFLPTIFLSYMVIWMAKNGREQGGELKKRATDAIRTENVWILFLLAFMGVFREGLETVLFLWGISLQSSPGESVTGPMIAGLSGSATAIMLVVILFKSSKHIPVSTFLRISSFLLIVMAGGLLAAGTGRLVAMGILPPIIFQTWDTSRILNEHSFFGGMFADFLGYRSKPPLIMILSVSIYLAGMFVLMRRAEQSGKKPSL